MKLSLLALALSCILVSALHAQLDYTDPQYRALCRAALAKPFTPPPDDPAFKPDCDSTTYYFGIGRPIDYHAARSCAFAEYGHSDPTSFNPFTGAGILSMIYANGQGTPPNLDLATRFTCENWAAPAEIETRLDILAADRETKTIQSFDLCDTASSGNSNDWCVSIEARLSEVDRNRAIDQFRSSLPAAAITAFEALQTAEKDFEASRSHNEVDLSGAVPKLDAFHEAEKKFVAARSQSESGNAGTVPIASQIEEQNDLGDRFLEDLKQITSPSFTEKTSLPVADKQLNVTYKQVHIAISKRFQNTTLTFKGAEQTQRTWLHLREAWMAFAAAASPTPSIDKQAGAFITLERIRQLNELIAAGL